MALTLRTARRLRAASLMLVYGVAVGIVAWSFRTPDATLAEPPLAAATSAAESSQSSLPAVDPQHAAWRRKWRQPLFDPPPAPPPVVVKPPLPPLQARLLATIIEPNASKAMVGLPGGAVEMRSAGEKLSSQDGEAIVVEIGHDSIKVARGEETTELKIEGSY